MGGSVSAGGSGTPGQGFPGGDSGSTPAGEQGGGGGGAAEAGLGRNQAAPFNAIGANAGAGVYSTISGANVAYAGGGGGGLYVGGTLGSLGRGGVGGGGSGGARSTLAPGAVLYTRAGSGVINTGGGGGGGKGYQGNSTPTGTIEFANIGGGGGAGVVVISHPAAYATATITGNTLVSIINSNVIYQFYSSGTIRW